jgi:hypothetical protein
MANPYTQPAAFAAKPAPGTFEAKVHELRQTGLSSAIAIATAVAKYPDLYNRAMQAKNIFRKRP